MSAGGDWQDLLRAQHGDLEKLEAMDAELNDEKISADIDKVLKKGSTTLGLYSRRPQSRNEDMVPPSPPPKPATPPVPPAYDELENDIGFTSRPVSRTSSKPTSRPTSRLRTNRESDGLAAPLSARSPRGPDGAADSPGATPQAPDATIRYQKARLKMLTKQIEDGQELRKQLNEAINDLQKQLKNERDENKKLKKR
jgi:hypothetical protein